MKKLIILLGFLLMNTVVFSQATNVADIRIADATTAFGVNLPLGTKVYDIATGDYWVATAGVASTLTLTTGSGSFTILNGGASAQDLSWNGTTHAVDITGGGSSAVIPLGTTSTDGLMTTTKFDEVDANNDKETNVSTDLSLGTRAATTMDVNSSDGNNVTLLAASTTEAGLMTDTQFDKLDAIEAGAEVNLTSLTEAFEEANGTPTAHTLSQTAVTAEGCRVSINGATLKPADYTLTTTTITLDGPVLQYDQVIITYFY